MNTRERWHATAMVALLAPWWVGTIWLAHTAWTWLTVTFGGPGYAGLAVGTIVSIGVVAWDEHHHWATSRRAPHQLGGWEPNRTHTSSARHLRTVPHRYGDCA